MTVGLTNFPTTARMREQRGFNLFQAIDRQDPEALCGAGRAPHATSAEQAQAGPAPRRSPALRDAQEAVRARIGRAYADGRNAELRTRTVARGCADHRGSRR